MHDLLNQINSLSAAEKAELLCNRPPNIFRIQLSHPLANCIMNFRGQSNEHE
jgi:hypothetical protein